MTTDSSSAASPAESSAAESSPYPLPAYAAYVWYDGQALSLQLPASAGEPGHTIRLSVSHAASWGVLLQVLLERYKASGQARTGRTIGNKASPVQYDIDELLRALGRQSARVGAEPRPAPTQLSDLGLDD